MFVNNKESIRTLSLFNRGLELAPRYTRVSVYERYSLRP